MRIKALFIFLSYFDKLPKFKKMIHSKYRCILFGKNINKLNNLFLFLIKFFNYTFYIIKVYNTLIRLISKYDKSK